jgi:di/tricarboxylate transporter
MAALSAFINNTPLMAILIPAVKEWCKRYRFPSSKLLLPVNYAAILGGTCTLIGTSTNLVTHGLLIKSGYPGFSFFELGRVGVPVTIVGILAIVFGLHRLLAKRKEVTESLGEQVREFVVEMKVNDQFAHLGKTIDEAGLRHLRGLFLFQIERGGSIITPIEPTERIRSSDRLFFTGIPSTILELQKTRGLDVVKDPQFDLKNYDSAEVKTYEVVLSPSSPLLGRTVRDTNFRSVYDAVILAIHRSGERVDRKIGDIVFKAGDTLLILADKEFLKRWYHAGEFLLVSQSDERRSKTKPQAAMAVAIALAMVAAASFDVLPMFTAAAIASLLLIFTRCLTTHEAFAAIDFRILVSIAGSFGIAKGLENAGVAKAIGELIVNLGTPYGIVAIIAAVYFATVALTEIVSNNAAAAILFPIGISVASQLNMDIMPFMYAITIGASAGFATPIGYQTSLMVQGPGGYRFSDYLKIGLPLDFIVGITAITMISFIFF